MAQQCTSDQLVSHLCNSSNFSCSFEALNDLSIPANSFDQNEWLWKGLKIVAEMVEEENCWKPYKDEWLWKGLKIVRDMFEEDKKHEWWTHWSMNTSLYAMNTLNELMPTWKEDSWSAEFLPISSNRWKPKIIQHHGAKGVVLSLTHLRTCDLGHLCLHLRSPVGDRHVKAVVAAHLESNFQFTLWTSMQTDHLQIFQYWIGNWPSRQPSPSNGCKQWGGIHPCLESQSLKQNSVDKFHSVSTVWHFSLQDGASI